VGCDLELEITAGALPGVYTVAVNSPAGTAAGTVRLDAAGLLGRRRELAASVLASAVTTRSGLSMLERPVREVMAALRDPVITHVPTAGRHQQRQSPPASRPRHQTPASHCC
jgi:hypothetical protein